MGNPGDQRVAESLLLLISEGKQERLISHSTLDVTRDGEVACQRRPAGIGIAERGQRNEAVQSVQVGHAQHRFARCCGCGSSDEGSGEDRQNKSF